MQKNLNCLLEKRKREEMRTRSLLALSTCHIFNQRVSLTEYECAGRLTRWGLDILIVFAFRYPCQRLGRDLNISLQVQGGDERPTIWDMITLMLVRGALALCTNQKFRQELDTSLVESKGMSEKTDVVTGVC